MNWESSRDIGLLAIVVVFLLFTPLRFWAAARGHKIRITKMGYVFYNLMIAVLIVGYSLSFLASETELGKFLGTRIGALIYTVAVMVVFGLLATVLQARGIILVKKIT